MTGPKRPPGRPRKHPKRLPRKTAKLTGTAGRAERFTFSISPELKARLSKLATASQVTESEQVRRLIKQASEMPE